MKNPAELLKESRLSKRNTSLLAASVLCMSGCAIDSYLSDANGVECDGKRTKVDFSDNIDKISFAAHSHADTLAISVTRIATGTYEFQTQTMTSDTHETTYKARVLSNNGAANPDYMVNQGNATWSVDVRDDGHSAVISGYCKE